MHIRQNGRLKNAKPRAATTNAPALTIIEVEVPTERFTLVEQLGELHRYVGHNVEIILRADPVYAAQDKKPMDEALEEVEQNGREERMRPGPTETCASCGNVIGDDPDAGFHTPLAGPPTPLCGACAVREDDQSIAEERRRQEREQFLAALEAKELTSELRTALLDAYDSGNQERIAHALTHAGLEQGGPSAVIPEDPDQYDEYLRWLREGDPDEGTPDRDDAGTEEGTREVGPLGRSSDIDPADLGDVDGDSADDQVEIRHGADGAPRVQRRRRATAETAS